MLRGMVTMTKNANESKSSVCYLSLLLVFVLGCTEPQPRGKWTIRVVRPDGVTAREYVVDSVEKPTPSTKWGGQTGVVDRGSNSFAQWEREIVAPTGWDLVIEPVR
jgi:hypothetical protein